MRDKLMLPETKKRIRELIERILIERGLRLMDVALESKSSYRTVYMFFNAPEKIGVNSMSKLAHFITKNGYKLEDFV